MPDCSRLPALLDAPHQAHDRCLIDDHASTWTTHAELAGHASRWAERLRGPRALVFHYVRNDVEGVAAMLGATRAGHAIALLSPDLPDAARQDLETRYAPEWIVDAGIGNGFRATGRTGGPAIAPELGLLLSTSGSTGSPKFVRLSWSGLTSNARAIAAALAIRPGDVGSGHLALHYAFGLSVLTSHLAAGAAVQLTEHSLASAHFWRTARDAGVTQLPGVPFHFRLFERLRYPRLDLPDLSSLIQAGGHLPIDSRRAAFEFMRARGGRFYVMYGQTEAAPRMTVLDPGQFPDAPGSVGQALPQGRITIDAPDANGHGAIVYHGPNVMLGYAQHREDLGRGDEQHGVLRTGDIGFLDGSGRLTITGRDGRIGKVFGMRLNLDDVERALSDVAECAVTQGADRLDVHLVEPAASHGPEATRLAVLRMLKRRASLPVTAIRLIPVERLPRTARGKIDYEALRDPAPGRFGID